VGPAVFDPDASDVAELHDTVATPAPTPAPAAAAAPAPSAQQRLARAFGDAVVSEKPLDEVVLDYLVENARKRKQRAK
jgi:hypothetical protein